MQELSIDPDEMDEIHEIDLITLRTDRLINGGSATDERSFRSLEGALAGATALPADQQERSWILMGSERLSLEDARVRLGLPGRAAESGHK
jgi:hypothetical protein